MAVKNYVTMNGQLIGEYDSERATDYILDGLGSVIGTWRSTGTIQNQYRYSGYGQQVHKSGTGADPYFLWVGGWGYRTRGMVYVRRRTYHDQASVWTSVDPFWPDESAYGYATCLPTILIDSSGSDVITLPPPNTSTPPSWFPPDRSPVRSPIRTSVPGSHQAGVVTVIVAGAYAVYDLVNWALTGNEGFFTGIGSQIGEACFPGIDSIPRDKAADCQDMYREYSKIQCPNASCNPYVTPRDCALIAIMLQRVTRCAFLRGWVINNCDKSPVRLPGWDPKKLAGHRKQMCSAIRAMCNCAVKARKCGLAAPPVEACRRMIDMCKGIGA